MRMLRTAAVMLAAATLGGCAHRLAQTELEHPSGWSREVRAEAQAAWALAHLSANVYGGPDPVDLGSAYEVKHHTLNDEIGLGHMVVEHRLPAGGTETIIVFRGTDFLTWQDWRYGNVGPQQNARGLEIVERVRRDRVDPRAPIIVTGHSLGGAIAMHVSLHQDNVIAYAFNTSPHFWLERRGFWRRPAKINDRHSIVEWGELLKALRVFGREADQLYTSIGCRRGFDPLGDHSIRPLANCLTAIAAWDDSEAWREAEVREALARNRIPWPEGWPRPPGP